jgi:uncharacterized membrane protein
MKLSMYVGLTALSLMFAVVAGLVLAGRPFFDAELGRPFGLLMLSGAVSAWCLTVFRLPRRQGFIASAVIQGLVVWAAGFAAAHWSVSTLLGHLPLGIITGLTFVNVASWLRRSRPASRARVID